MTSLKLLKKQNSEINSLPTFRVAVFGETGVGKTAFIVRFVTSKFIGEYDRALEFVYQYTYSVSQFNPVFFEMLDTPCRNKENTEILEEKVRWADAFILLYSVTDPCSFSEIHRLKFLISHITSNIATQKTNLAGPPIAIVGNKKDVENDRMVSKKNGKALADSLHALFFEVSVRESVEEVAEVFESLYKTHKHVQRVNHFQTKSSSYRELAIRPNLNAKKKHKSFKHINKVPRMQGSPEMKRATFRQRGCKLHTDSENSDTGDERHAIEHKKTETVEHRESSQGKRNRYAAASNMNSLDSKNDQSSCCNSSDEGGSEEKPSAAPLSEAFVRQIAEEFHRKTVLLPLK